MIPTRYFKASLLRGKRYSHHVARYEFFGYFNCPGKDLSHSGIGRNCWHHASHPATLSSDRIVTRSAARCEWLSALWCARPRQSLAYTPVSNERHGFAGHCYVLEHDAQRQDEILAELERELALQAERIKVQPELLAGLHDTVARPPWVASTEPPTTTEQFDKDVWTLITAAVDIEKQTLTSMRAIRTLLNDRTVLERATVRYPEFVQLEKSTYIQEHLKDRLAIQMVNFAALIHETVSDPGEFSTANQEFPFMTLVESLRADTFSLAQQDV